MVNIWRLLPIILIFLCIGEVVKTASLLSAIAELNLNVIGKFLRNFVYIYIGVVLEQQELDDDLVRELQNKVALINM